MAPQGYNLNRPNLIKVIEEFQKEFVFEPSLKTEAKGKTIDQLKELIKEVAEDIDSEDKLSGQAKYILKRLGVTLKKAERVVTKNTTTKRYDSPLRGKGAAKWFFEKSGMEKMTLQMCRTMERLSQRELGEKVGACSGSIHNLERWGWIPTATSRSGLLTEDIEKYFGVPILWGVELEIPFNEVLERCYGGKPIPPPINLVKQCYQEQRYPQLKEILKEYTKRKN